MKSLIPLFLFLVFSCIGCSKIYGGKQDNANVVYAQIPNEEAGSAEERIAFPDSLAQFRSVVDTLNAADDHLVQVEYFLYDVSGDAQPELWIVSGTCEADKQLWVYQCTNDSVRKILADYGGHTEFFLKDHYIGSLTCNTGIGCVNLYTYNDGKILVESIEYNGWNEEEFVKVKTARDKFIADIWENSDSTIYLKPLK